MTVLKMVSLTEPCSACVMIDGLIHEMLDKLLIKFPQARIEYQVVEHLKDIRQVKGLEVEKFPALFLNDDQITAGTLPTPQQLRIWVEETCRG